MNELSIESSFMRSKRVPLAIMTLSAVPPGPMPLVAFKLRVFQPSAKTPILPTLVMIVLIIVYVGLST